MDDSRIVELYLARDESAVTETDLKYGAKLRAIAFGVMGDAHSAEECVNDAYLEAWRIIPPNRPEGYLFRFMGSIVRHKAIDRCRREAAAKRSAPFTELTKELQECIPSGETTEQRAEANELRRAVNAWLASLSDEKRSVFLRRYWFFDSVSEIASSFGFSESKVKSMLARMRGGLRGYLEREGYEV